MTPAPPGSCGGILLEGSARGAGGRCAPPPSPPPPFAPTRCVGAFTLIELLIVIVLLISIGAIVMPFTIVGMNRSGFDDAQKHYEGAVMMARAEAQRRGVVLELVARKDVAGTTLFTREVEKQGGADQQTGGGGEERSGAPVVGVENELLALPAGISVSEVDPTLKTESDQPQPVDPAEGAGPGTSGSVSASGQNGEVILGLFFPDGQIEPSAARFLVGSEDRVARMEINRWTGATSATIVVRDSKADSQNVEEPAGPARADDPGKKNASKDPAEAGDNR